MFTTSKWYEQFGARLGQEHQQRPVLNHEQRLQLIHAPLPVIKHTQSMASAGSLRFRAPALHELDGDVQ